MRSMKLQNFLLVARLPENNVELVFLAPSEDIEDVSTIDRAVMREWRRLAGEFKYPEYDVITARGENLEMVQKAFPELRGWERAKTAKIQLSYEAGGSSHT